MAERRVRVAGRPQYGRLKPVSSRPVSRRGAKRGVVASLTPLQKRIGLLALGIVVLGWGLLQLFKVSTVTVQSPSRGAEIQVEARSIIAGKWTLGNLLTFDETQFAQELTQIDPLLKSVSVKRKPFHTLVVTATLKQPSLAWSTGNQGYILDRDGTVIGSVSGPSNLPMVYDGSNLPVQIGQKATSPQFVAFASGIVPALAKQGLGVTRLDIKETTIDLTATTNKGYRLLFDTSRGVGDEMADLAAVQRLLTTQKKTPAEYIDLRIAGKAYYK